MICERKLCSGCMACLNICPKNAIVISYDEFGFAYPKIIEQQCVKCGLCNKVCPQININKINWHEPKNVYAMISKDINININSTSGGIARVFYEKVIDMNGVVYGCDNINNGEINIVRVTSKDELDRLQGSKYVQANINKIYSEVKEDLDKRSLVIFIGTPCQVAGLNMFLNKVYDNLFIVDIICHGVPSQKILLEELRRHNLKTDDISKIIFRKGKEYMLTVFNKKGEKIFSEYSNKNDYLINFLRSRINRLSCYDCKFASNKRVSDVTIGDFWGLDKDSELSKRKNAGISVVITNTDKGQKLIDLCKENLVIENRSFDEAKKENSQLRHSSIASKAHIKFFKIYPKLGYNKTIVKIEDIKDKVKKNNIIYNVINKIKKLNM